MLIFLLIILLIGLYILFRIIKWVVKKKIRITWAFVVVVTVALTSVMKLAFFTKMEFIQSNVYPDLFLIKNPVSERDSIQRAIEEMVLKKVATEFLDNQEAYEFSEKQDAGSSYRLRFYEYYNGTSLLIPFGEAGTVHFIDHLEDPGGFTSEELVHYSKYRVAEFNLDYCKNDTSNYAGILNFYKNWDIIQKDTLIDQCQSIRNTDSSESAEIVSDDK